MAALYLIRHGQASFGKADYDMLSELGMNQARMLGKHWQLKGVPRKNFAGDLIRHGQTLEGFMESFSDQKVPVILDSGFNEFDHVEVLTRYNHQWHNFAEMSASLKQLKDPNKSFQKEFTQALLRWTSGDFDHEYNETWTQFKNRCVRALQNLMQQELAAESSQNAINSAATNDIMVFTSGGTIAAIIQHILQLSDEQTFQVNQQLRNTSVTKLLFSKDKLSIDYFNNYSHLELLGEQWVTFR
jgi:broad specificity phosphatase PhoE